MTRRIPHRALHASWMEATSSDQCPSEECLLTSNVMHHDHLMNYALSELRRRAPQSFDAPSIWRLNGESFRRCIRFMPVMVCHGCNNGDGWAKAFRWCNVAKRVYPNSFSMTIDEMAEMRDADRGLSRRAVAESIWSRVGADHLDRRRDVRRIVRELIEDEMGGAFREGRQRP